MGAKTWMLVIADGDAREHLSSTLRLDSSATERVAAELFQKETLEPLPRGSLAGACPPDDEIVAGCFDGITVLAAREFGLDRPSTLDRRFLAHAGARNTSLHAMHSVVDWFAYAVWHGGTLTRSLSLSPDSGIIEDLGPRMPFEAPFWAGEHPLEAADPEEDDYPFPFHTLELGEAALAELFGYVLEGPPDAGRYDPATVPLLRFRRRKPWFRFW